MQTQRRAGADDSRGASQPFVHILAYHPVRQQPKAYRRNHLRYRNSQHSGSVSPDIQPDVRMLGTGTPVEHVNRAKAIDGEGWCEVLFFQLLVNQSATTY